MRISNVISLAENPERKHALTCLHSLKRIRNNSVYCTDRDRGWLSCKYCELCLDYKFDPAPSTITILPEVVIDGDLPVISESKF